MYIEKFLQQVHRKLGEQGITNAKLFETCIDIYEGENEIFKIDRKGGMFYSSDNRFRNTVDIAGDLHKVRAITNTVIETSNTFMRKKKDMTDFIMLDYIYQAIERQKGIDTYILFTGDGHFQTVVKYLKEKRKRVIVCGFEDSFSKQLRDTASEVIMVDIEKELFERNCKMVLNSMAMIEDQKDLLANFLQAVENVSKASNIPEEEFGKMLVRALKLGCEKS